MGFEDLSVALPKNATSSSFWIMISDATNRTLFRNREEKVKKVPLHKSEAFPKLN